MEKYEPKEQKIGFVTNDWEWYTHEGKQYPYMFGLYYVINDVVHYFDY